LISGNTRSGTGVSFLHFLWVSKAYKSQKNSSRYLFLFGRYDDCTVLGRTPCTYIPGCDENACTLINRSSKTVHRHTKLTKACEGQNAKSRRKYFEGRHQGKLMCQCGCLIKFQQKDSRQNAFKSPNLNYGLQKWQEGSLSYLTVPFFTSVFHHSILLYESMQYTRTS